MFCGDRWSDFAGNGLGYNQWCPATPVNAGLSLVNSRIDFNSVNYTVRNCSFELPASVEVHTINGKAVFVKYLRFAGVNGDLCRIPVEQFKQGRYIVKVTSGNYQQIQCITVVK